LSAVNWCGPASWNVKNLKINLKKLFITGQSLAKLQRRLQILQKCCLVDTQGSLSHGVERKLEITLKQFKGMGKQIKSKLVPFL
jgi:hypothetical protein